MGAGCHISPQGVGWQERAVSGHLITAGKFKHKHDIGQTPLHRTQADSGYERRATPPPLWVSASPSAKWGSELEQGVLKIF